MDTEQRIDRAKHPRSILAGPYGHPFHAIAITIPIGAWTASLVFDIVALVTRESAFAIGAALLVGIGLVGAVLAAVFGLMDLSQIAPGTVTRRLAIFHMVFNLTAMTLFTIALVLRMVAGADEPNAAAFIVGAVAFLLVGASGFLGGELVYRYGVRVAAEDTQAKGFEIRAG
jgi:uncharacterized membrane protein